MEPARLPARVARQAIPMRPYGMVNREPPTKADVMRTGMQVIKKKKPLEPLEDTPVEYAHKKKILEMTGQGIRENLQKSRQRVGGAVLTGGIEEDDYPEVREAKQKAEAKTRAFKQYKQDEAVEAKEYEPVSEDVRENAEYRARYIRQFGKKKDKKQIDMTGRAGV